MCVAIGSYASQAHFYRTPRCVIAKYFISNWYPAHIQSVFSVCSFSNHYPHSHMREQVRHGVQDIESGRPSSLVHSECIEKILKFQNANEIVHSIISPAAVDVLYVCTLLQNSHFVFFFFL